MFRPKKGRPEEPAVPEEPEFDEPADAFLGTLRSELDEPEDVPAGFKRLQEKVEGLVADYMEGKLQKRDLAEILSKQRALDAFGAEWTLGATTGAWYRRPGGAGSWMRVPGPSAAIGEPVGGPWQDPIEYPSAPEDAQDETPDASAEEAPAAASGTPGREPVTYDETFDAGLAALLGDEQGSGAGGEERVVDDAPIAPRHGASTGPVTQGPAPRDPGGWSAEVGEDEEESGLDYDAFLDELAQGERAETAGGAAPEGGSEASVEDAGAESSEAAAAEESGGYDFLDDEPASEREALEPTSPDVVPDGSVEGLDLGSDGDDPAAGWDDNLPAAEPAPRDEVGGYDFLDDDDSAREAVEPLEAAPAPTAGSSGGYDDVLAEEPVADDPAAGWDDGLPAESRAAEADRGPETAKQDEDGPGSFYLPEEFFWDEGEK